MGYYVRFLREKKKAPYWKLQFVSYRKRDAPSGRAKRPRKECDVAIERYQDLGFRQAMTIDEARARQRQLNSGLRLRRISDRHLEIELKAKQSNLANAATFPEPFLVEFERRFLLRRNFTDSDRRPSAACWSTAKRIILGLQLEPREWFDSVDRFYDYFHENAWSLSYIRKLLRLINHWGYFISRKMGMAFLPVPSPRGYERSRLSEAYYKKIADKRRKSDPISAVQLEATRTQLHERHYNWLLLSVWAGLRPSEIDRLKQPGNFHIKRIPKGPSVLWIYQEKLVALPPWERWKLIPLISKQQKGLSKIVRSGAFARPCVKTLRRYFGEGVGLYGGRKGFTDLMLNRGYRLEEVSAWMGHTSIERTWRSYRDRLHVRYLRA